MIVNINNIKKIAGYEIKSIINSKIVLIISTLLILMAIINILGFTHMVSKFVYSDYKQVFFMNVSNFSYFIIMISAFFSMCIIILSIAEGKNNGSLNILSSKPVTRNDIIISKYISTNLFMFAYNVAVVSFFVFLMTLFYGFPNPLFDVLTRLAIFLFLIFVNCALSTSIITLFAIFFEELLPSLIFSTFYIILQWLAMTPIIYNIFGDYGNINPSTLYLLTINDKQLLFDTSTNIMSWLNNGIPYIFLMMLELIVIIILCLIVFNRKDY